MRAKNQPGDGPQYSEQETAKRRDEWLRRSLSAPPKQHKDMVAERKEKRGSRKPEPRK